MKSLSSNELKEVSGGFAFVPIFIGLFAGGIIGGGAGYYFGKNPPK